MTQRDFFYRLEVGRRGDELQSAYNVSPAFSQKWTENERFGVEQGGTADLVGFETSIRLNLPPTVGYNWSRGLDIM